MLIHNLQLLKKDIKAQGNEDQYGGMGVPEHGYATATPATDGKAVYVYLGKTGLIAFDLNGRELWRAATGRGGAPPARNGRFARAYLCAILGPIDARIVVKHRPGGL